MNSNSGSARHGEFDQNAAGVGAGGKAGVGGRGIAGVSRGGGGL